MILFFIVWFPLPSFLLLHPTLSIWGGMILPLLFRGLHIISCREGIGPFSVISTPNLHRDTGKQQQHWSTPSVGYSFPSSTTCILSIENTFPSFTGGRIRRIDNKGEDLYYYEWRRNSTTILLIATKKQQ